MSYEVAVPRKGVWAAKESCKHCYGRGYDGVRLEKAEEGWNHAEAVPCKCLKLYPARKYIPRGWTPIAKKIG